MTNSELAEIPFSTSVRPLAFIRTVELHFCFKWFTSKEVNSYMWNKYTIQEYLVLTSSWCLFENAIKTDVKNKKIQLLCNWKSKKFFFLRVTSNFFGCSYLFNEPAATCICKKSVICQTGARKPTRSQSYICSEAYLGKLS